MERSQQAPRIVHEDPRCPFCHDTIESGAEQLACNGCRAWHHQPCWGEGGSRCSACGVAATGVVERSSADLVDPAEEIAPVVWGDEVAEPHRPLGGYVLSAILALTSLCFVAIGLFALLREGALGLPLVLGVLAVLSGLQALGMWPGSNDPEWLRLPVSSERNSESLRRAIAARFQQSEEAFHKTGLSLAEPGGLELEHTLVLCIESLTDLRGLLPVLEALALSTSGTALALVAGEVHEDVLGLFRVNCGRGVFPGFVLRAEPEQLALLAAASGGEVVPSTRTLTMRDLGRLKGVRFTQSAAQFGQVEIPLLQP